jgi:imidazolonepropionase-like amidohydrolase
MIKGLARSVLLFLPFFLSAQQTPGVKQRILVLTHVTVIDTGGAPAQPDVTVIITGNRITEMGGSGKIHLPKNAQVVNATGKFLIPGLWDMHTHPLTEDDLSLFMANGVTGVRVMWGQPDHYQWRREIEAGKLIGPRMVIASVIIDGPKPYWPGWMPVANEAQARQAVIEAKQSGADFVKVLEFLPRDLYLDIVDESKKQGIPFAGHVPITVSAEEASRAGQRSFEHLVGILPACSTHSEEWNKAAQADLTEYLASDKRQFEGSHVRALAPLMLDTYSADKAGASSLFSKRTGHGSARRSLGYVCIASSAIPLSLAIPV